jgi:hypothetical protein
MDLLNKNKAKISDLLSQTFDLIQARYGMSEQLFTVASVWGQIIFVLDNLSQFILFFIEDSITELNINTATRESSIYGLAALAGHNPTRSIAAKGEIVTKWNGKGLEDIGGGAVLIPNNSQVKCINNGKTYLLKLGQEYVRLNLDGTSTLSASVIEGVLNTNQYTGTGGKLQSYNISARGTSGIENFEVDVRVNGNTWKKYDSLYDIPRNARGYMVKSSLISGIDVFFGTVDFGFPPPSGAIIEVDYLECSGADGNLLLDDSSQALFKFDSDGTDIFGRSVTLSEVLQVNCTIAPQLGASQEPIDLTRLIAPKTSRSFVLANPTNYITFFEKFGQFSIIEAFTTFDDQYLDDDNIIYLILVPDIQLTLKSNETYFDIPLSRFKLTNAQRDRIYQLLDESGQKIVTTVVKILDPVLTKYVVNIALTIFEGNDPDTIKSQITSILSDYFLNIRRRDKIPRSDLIAAIESISGVDSVSLYFVGESNEAAKLQSPNSPDIGFDEFGDIVMGKDEIVVISGGWEDRNGIYYDYGAGMSSLSSVNIDIRSIVPVTYNTRVNSILKSSLNTGN